MARKDYAKPKNKINHNRGSSRQSSNASFGASALLIAMVGVLGLIITVMLALNKLHLVPGNHKSSHTKQASPTPSSIKKQEKRQQTTAPRYDFYTLLPENDTQPTTKPTKAVRENTLSHSHRYFLQVASFSNSKEADSLRAQLILEGLNAHIEKVTAKEKLWYRIVAGPYDTQKKAENIQRLLQKNHHLKSLLLEK
ncbi:MAG: SPOR domain-containing protein [Gammaproteobacteria bacterium]